MGAIAYLKEWNRLAKEEGIDKKDHPQYAYYQQTRRAILQALADEDIEKRKAKLTPNN